MDVTWDDVVKRRVPPGALLYFQTRLDARRPGDGCCAGKKPTSRVSPAAVMHYSASILCDAGASAPRNSLPSSLPPPHPPPPNNTTPGP